MTTRILCSSPGEWKKKKKRICMIFSPTKDCIQCSSFKKVSISHLGYAEAVRTRLTEAALLEQKLPAGGGRGRGEMGSATQPPLSHPSSLERSCRRFSVFVWSTSRPPSPPPRRPSRTPRCWQSCGC